MNMKGRCTSVYPGAVTLKGKPVRCEGRIGHEGRHGHSFAARYWDDGGLPVFCQGTDR